MSARLNVSRAKNKSTMTLKWRQISRSPRHTIVRELVSSFHFRTSTCIIEPCKSKCKTMLLRRAVPWKKKSLSAQVPRSRHAKIRAAMREVARCCWIHLPKIQNDEERLPPNGNPSVISSSLLNNWLRWYFRRRGNTNRARRSFLSYFCLSSLYFHRRFVCRLLISCFSLGTPICMQDLFIFRFPCISAIRGTSSYTSTAWWGACRRNSLFLAYPDGRRMTS